MKTIAKQQGTRTEGGKRDDVCPSLMCACQDANAEKAGNYKPSRFQLQEHCMQGRHVRCPIQCVHAPGK